MPNKKKSKVDKTPKRKVPEGFEFPKNKRTVPNPPGVPRKPAVGTKKPMRAPKYPGQPLALGTTPNTPIRVQRSKPVTPAKPKAPVKKSGVTVVLPNGSTVGLKDLGKVKPTPKPKQKVTPKKPPKMTPQDAAMQKILKDRYGW